MTKIFISYRRDDTLHAAGRVHDRLATEFGRDVLFMDVDAIPIGANFASVLSDEVAKCDVLLALVGPRWLQQDRLNDANDFVRIEIATALARNIIVIPVLFDGTRVPMPNELPADLQDLSLRNAVEVRGTSFHADMDRLVRALKAYANVDRRRLPEARVVVPDNVKKVGQREGVDIFQGPDGSYYVDGQLCRSWGGAKAYALHVSKTRKQQGEQL
jgi:hypothetical protein